MLPVLGLLVRGLLIGFGLCLELGFVLRFILGLELAFHLDLELSLDLVLVTGVRVGDGRLIEPEGPVEFLRHGVVWRPLAREHVDPGLRGSQERRQRARQCVNLMCGEHGAVDQLGLVLRQQPFEPEQQRVLLPPLDRRNLESCLDVRQCRVERVSAHGSRRQCLPGGLAFKDETLTCKSLCALDRGRTRKGGGITHQRAFKKVNVEKGAAGPARRLNCCSRYVTRACVSGVSSETGKRPSATW